MVSFALQIILVMDCTLWEHKFIFVFYVGCNFKGVRLVLVVMGKVAQSDK